MDRILKSFDKFGTPVAQLNMAGTTEYRTRLGGACGLVIYCLMLWFSVLRIKRMINKDSPILTEVTQKVDLLADDTPILNLAQSKFEFGYNIIGYTFQFVENEDETMMLEKGESLNHVFNEIVIPEFFQVNLTQDGYSIKLVD